MGRAFEYRKAAKLKRWGHMAKTFTRLGKQIAIAVKAGGPEPENNPALRSVIATCKRENMPKDNIERAIKNAMGKDQSDYKSMTYEGYGPHGVAVFVDTLTDNPPARWPMCAACSTSLAEPGTMAHWLSCSTTNACSLSRRKTAWIWKNSSST